MKAAVGILLLTSTTNGATSNIKNPTNWPRYDAYASNTGSLANTMHSLGYACIRNNWVYNFPQLLTTNAVADAGTGK